MTDSQPPTPGAAVPCIRCQYPLPDLSPGSVCPECATPVERSLTPAPLALADPAYLGVLVRGLSGLLLAVCTILLGLLLAAVSFAFALSTQSSAVWGSNVCAVIWLFALGVLWPLGADRLTRRELSSRAPCSHGAVRRCARNSAQAQAIAWGSLVLLWVLNGVLPYSAEMAWAAFFFALLVSIGITFAQVAITTVYLWQLGFRIPSRAVRRYVPVILLCLVIAAAGILDGLLILSGLTPGSWSLHPALFIAPALLPLVICAFLSRARRDIRVLLRQTAACPDGLAGR